MKDPATATERVGRYQLLEPIGAGPNGAVWRAKVFGVAGFERQFAIKRFLPELTANPAMAQALSAAARSYGSLEHPRIARMSEFGVAQGQTYAAVEHVTGLDAMRMLAEAKLGGTGLAVGGALALVSQAARAVGYAHGRGLSHLGLAPTNVIITGDGDVKVTDFGMLAALMPGKPVEVARLANRLGYLAPEQLAGEATSAATDVFVLGVIAYELVSGERAYGGATPQQTVQAILAGPPAEPSLPRPIVRVLQRCVARSPFERFPDARAFADALDAALRVAPVPGTRKDIGALVRATLERFAAMNEGNMSGVVALNVGTGPVRAIPKVNAGSETADPSTTEFVRPDVPVPGPAPLVGPARGSDSPAATMPDLPKPFTTVPGLAPPPIPVPAGVAAGTAAPPGTMLGMTAAKRPLPSVIPSIKKPSSPPPFAPNRPPVPERTASPSSPPPRPASPSTPPTRPETATVTDAPRAGTDAPRAESFADLILEPVDETGTEDAAAEPEPGRAARPSFQGEVPTGELSPGVADRLNAASTRPTGELPAALAEVYESERVGPDASEPSAELSTSQVPRSSSTMPGFAPAPAATRRGAPQSPTLETRTPPSRLPKLLLGLVVLGGLGAGGWYAYTRSQAGDATVVATKGSATPHGSAATSGSAASAHAGSGSATALASGSGSAAATASGSGSATTTGSAAATGSAAVPATGSATATATASGSGSGSAATAGSGSATAVADHGSAAAPVDAGVARLAVDAAIATPTNSTDALQIVSTPAGARVFIDGADQGATPLKMPGSADRHTIALLLPGHDLYIGEVDGHGTQTITVPAVTPPGGPAGIKVIKCKDKERYYVYLDGKPTGMTCPTERLGCDVGPHTVEVYDVVTETRRKWDIQVKDTRLSVRVRIE